MRGQATRPIERVAERRPDAGPQAGDAGDGGGRGSDAIRESRVILGNVFGYVPKACHNRSV